MQAELTRSALDVVHRRQRDAERQAEHRARSRRGEFSNPEGGAKLRNYGGPEDVAITREEYHRARNADTSTAQRPVHHAPTPYRTEWSQ